MPRLSLFLPGLRRSADVKPADPALGRLLARADWQPAADGLPQRLLETTGFIAAGDLPIAALCAMHDLDLDTPDAAWCRADPVHLRADPRLVLLLAPKPGEVSLAAASAKLEALRQHLPEYEWRMGKSAERWYVRAPELRPTSPHGTAWVNGRSVTPFVSREPAAQPWRLLFNDAQMVLHAAETAAADNAAGAPPLNALWLWGSGDVARGAAPPPFCVGNDVLLAGAARAAGGRWAAALGCEEVVAEVRQRDVVLMVDAPWGAALPEVPVLSLETFVRDWLPNLWRALGRDGFEQLALVGETDSGMLLPAGRWRVWRRSSSLTVADLHAIPDAP